MKKYRFEKSVLHEDGYAIIHNESGEKIAECEDAEKAHFLMTAANSFNLDEIELEKEVERLKGLLRGDKKAVEIWNAARQTVLCHHYNGSERDAAWLDKYNSLDDFINNNPRQPN